MLESFLEYKINCYKNAVNLGNISEAEKKEYELFFRECILVDSNGKLIVTKKLIEELYEFIRLNKFNIVMNPKDTMISMADELPNSNNYKGKLFENLNDIVAVHVTKIPPLNDMIKTKESSEVKRMLSFFDPNTKKEHSIEYISGSDTIHFTLNCAVQNHLDGNDWASYEYGVLTEFSNLDKSKVLDVKSEDTYLDGDVNLSNYYLFCPLGERDKLAKENPNAIIIEYDGITLSDAISYMIILTGHKLETYGTYGWGRNTEYGKEDIDTLKLEKCAIKNGYPVLKGRFGNALHSETKYMARRMWKTEYNALISLLKYNSENNIEMPDDVIFNLLKNNGVYCFPGTVPVTLEDYKNVVFPILKNAGYEVDDSLFDDIVVDYNEKIIYPPAIYQIPNWEHEVRDRVISIIKNTKQNKKASI